MDVSNVRPSPDWTAVAGDPSDDDAIKLSIATSASAALYSGAALDGVIGVGTMDPTSLIDITTGAHASTYNTTDPIVIDGTDWSGNALQDSIKLTAVGGGEVVSGMKAFATVTKITVPAQLTTSGTFKFGRGALAFQPATRGFEAGAAGAFKLFTATGKAATITLPVNAYRQVAVSKIDKTQAVFPYIVYR
jgi:hypothetical protein